MTENSEYYMLEKVGWLVGWFVRSFYGVSTLFGSFNADLNFKKSV